MTKIKMNILVQYDVTEQRKTTMLFKINQGVNYIEGRGSMMFYLGTLFITSNFLSYVPNREAQCMLCLCMLTTNAPSCNSKKDANQSRECIHTN